MASSTVATSIATNQLPSFSNPAKATLEIEDFLNKNSGSRSVVFALPSNDQIQFALVCYYKCEYAVMIAGESTWIYLQLNQPNRDKVTVRYRISIITTNGDRCETRDGRANFSTTDNSRYGARWYIDHAYLLDPANELLVNGKLIIHCEVEEIDNCSSVNSSSVVIEFNQMSKDYEALLESGELSDAVLVAGDKELHIHKAIVAARSPVFAAMFKHDNTKEAQENRVEITDVDVEVLEQLLRYIYTSKVEALDRYAADLLVAADKYQLECLKSTCEQKLYSEITVETVSNLFLLADMHQATELNNKCLDYITENCAQVMASDGWKKIMIKPDLMVMLLELSNSKYLNARDKK